MLVLCKLIFKPYCAFSQTMTDKMIIYCMVASALLISTASTQFVPICKTSFAWIRNPNNCSEFWRCDNFRPLKMSCPVGLILNLDIKNCVRRNGLYDDCGTITPPQTIPERCAAGEQIIPHETECQLFYNCSLFYNEVPKFFTQHMDECRYPDLFDVVSKTCHSFKEVECGQRIEHKSACDYRRSRCGSPHCQPCSVTCVGQPDGHRVYTGREWSPYYVVCDQERSIEVRTCDKDENLNIARLFSPVTNQCEPLYLIPRIHGGLAPDCESDGLFSDEESRRCDIYIRCAGGIAVDVVKCPGDLVFDSENQICRPNTEFCDVRCGRGCQNPP